MKIYILAAGKGSRMGSFSQDWPKVMTRINQETLIARLVRQWHTWSDQTIHIVARPHANTLRTHLESLRWPTATIVEPPPYLEAGQSILFARAHAKEDVWISSGDIWIPDSFFCDLPYENPHHKLWIQGDMAKSSLTSISDSGVLHNGHSTAAFTGIGYWKKSTDTTLSSHKPTRLTHYIQQLITHQKVELEGKGNIRNINTRSSIVDSVNS